MNWTSPCGEGATCINKPGSYYCKCPPGFTGDPEVECTDINECGLASKCAVNARCMNTPGSAMCYCPKGFEGDGDTTCDS